MKTRQLIFTILLALVCLPAIAQTAAQSAGTDTKNAAKNVGSATSTATKTAADKVTGKIDINSASKDDLMKLQGIGDAISAKIIAGRPYHSKRDLLTRKIVNQSTYDKISDKIIAHAPAK